MAKVETEKRPYRRQMSDMRLSSMNWGAMATALILLLLIGQNASNMSGHIEVHNHPEKYGAVFENPNYFDKYRVWMGIFAGALILLVELFALAVNYWLPLDKHRKFTAISHFVAAIILVVAAFFLILYVINIYQATCGENGYVTRWNNEIEARNNNITANGGFIWSEINCPAAAFLTSNSVSTSSRLGADKKDWPGGTGFMAFFILLAVLPALGQAVECIRIFLLASNQKIVEDASSPTKSEGDYNSVPLSSRSSFDSGL